MIRGIHSTESPKTLLVNPTKCDRPEAIAQTLQVCPNTRIGFTAQALSNAPKFSGTILAVVTNSVYLTTCSDEILWLAQTQLPAHTRAILASFDPRTIRVGMNARIENARLVIGNAAIDLRNAEVWQPPIITHPSSLEIVEMRAREAQTVIVRSGVGDDAISKLNIGDGFAKTVRNVMASHSLFALRKLIGLGTGLTPAGDDFVGGILFAAHHLQKIYPDRILWENQPVNELLEYARAQTNCISFAILRDLARGDGPESLHNFIIALLSDSNANPVHRSLTRVLAIGHTTGRAMLDGVLTGIQAATSQ